jgi:hypothetical protein
MLCYTVKYVHVCKVFEIYGGGWSQSSCKVSNGGFFLCFLGTVNVCSRRLVYAIGCGVEWDASIKWSYGGGWGKGHYIIPRPCHLWDLRTPGSNRWAPKRQDLG